MKNQIGGYSKYIRAISVLLDLLCIVFLCLFVFDISKFDISYYVFYLIFSWLLVAFFTGFYEIYRFTSQVEIVSKLVNQFSVFTLSALAYFAFLKINVFEIKTGIIFVSLSFLLVGTSKFILNFFFRKYRIITGSNYRNVVILGYSKEAKELRNFFEKRKEFGYRFFGFFSDTHKNEEIKGDFLALKPFVVENNINEIYCSLKDISQTQLKGFVDFAAVNNITVKFIPATQELFSKNLKIDYYDFFPVLSLKRTKLREPISRLIKRSFDVLFSLVVIILVLSWLLPILAILIKLDSKGPIFFKQGRPGLDGKEFFCYKFRSMRINNNTEREASKNDPRVTKVGKFLRRTSLDELPQFFNVLINDMSVVGPRPHLWSQKNTYEKTIKKYMIRHYVKPGVTGLAQTKGFRGEIETKEDMINRVRFDVFYIENWSLILDIRIIIQTVFNVFQGEVKAY